MTQCSNSKKYIAHICRVMKRYGREYTRSDLVGMGGERIKLSQSTKSKLLDKYFKGEAV